MMDDASEDMDYFDAVAHAVEKHVGEARANAYMADMVGSLADVLARDNNQAGIGVARELAGRNQVPMDVEDGLPYNAQELMEAYWFTRSYVDEQRDGEFPDSAEGYRELADELVAHADRADVSGDAINRFATLLERGEADTVLLNQRDAMAADREEIRGWYDALLSEVEAGEHDGAGADRRDEPEDTSDGYGGEDEGDGSPGGGPDDGSPSSSAGDGPTRDAGLGDESSGPSSRGGEGAGRGDGPGMYMNMELDVGGKEPVASPSDPFNPEYTLKLTAYAPGGSPEAAREYAASVLAASDEITMTGWERNASAADREQFGAYDLPDTWDELEDLMETEFTGQKGLANRGRDGTYTMEITDMELGDWDITEGGRYRIKADMGGKSTRSGLFGVEGEDGETGLSLSVVTMEEAGLTTGINRSAEPGYLVMLDAENMNEEQYREAAESYLRDEFDELAVEWGEAEEVWELGDGAFPVMGDTTARTVDPATMGTDYFDPFVDMEDAYVEQGWLYHPGMNRFMLHTPIPAEFEEGDDLGMRVSAVDGLEADEGPGYDYAAWTDVDDFGRMDLAMTVLGAADWIDRGMPIGDEEAPEAAAEVPGEGAWGRVRNGVSNRFGSFLGDVPDHLITDALEKHTFLGKYVE